jgi:L-asparaginase II
VLAVEVRSGLVETVHDGAVAVVNTGGQLVASFGDIDRPFYLRSAAKPFQALVSRDNGAHLAREQLAMACASHDGHPVQVALVESILQGAGLSPTHLGNPSAWPSNSAAARRLAASGATAPSRVWHNCSGKHAAMLAATVASGWDPTSYLDPAHPLQVRIADLVREIGGPVEPIGIDGCGAPVFATTARAMGRAFATLSSAPEFVDVFAAMHSYPALISGPGNPDTVITTNLDAVAKRGAAGALGVGLRGQLGLAIKVWSGSALVSGVAAAAALDQLGVLTPYGRERLEVIARPIVKGGGLPVGRFEPRMELRWQ